MNEAMVNFIFALIVGRSAACNLNRKTLLDNLWDDYDSVEMYVSILTDSYIYGQMILAMKTYKRGKKKGNAE